MSSSQDSQHGEEQLVRYLLGLLPDEEAERLDEMSITDEDMASRLVAVENDLVDAYVRGSLAGATLEQFRAHYLTSPHRLRMVRFAEGFVRAADAAAPDPASSRSSSILQRLPRTTTVWSLAVAAALLLVVSGALFVRDMRVRDGLREAQRQGTALDHRVRDLEQLLDKERSASAATAKELEGVRASLAGLTERSATTGAPPAAARAPITVALVLVPQTRSGGPVPTIATSSGADGVAIELLLETDDFSQYEATLQDPATNQIVWRSGRAAATSAGGQRGVSLSVPARVLKSQHYAAVLNGYDAAGDAHIVGSYTFRIVRR